MFKRKAIISDDYEFPRIPFFPQAERAIIKSIIAVITLIKVQRVKLKKLKNLRFEIGGERKNELIKMNCTS